MYQCTDDKENVRYLLDFHLVLVLTVNACCWNLLKVIHVFVSCFVVYISLSLSFSPSPISQVVINGSLHHAAAGGLVSVFVRATLACWDEHATASDLCHSPGCHFLQGVWQQRKGQGQGPGQ